MKRNEIFNGAINSIVYFILVSTSRFSHKNKSLQAEESIKNSFMLGSSLNLLCGEAW